MRVAVRKFHQSHPFEQGLSTRSCMSLPPQSIRYILQSCEVGKERILLKDVANAAASRRQIERLHSARFVGGAKENSIVKSNLTGVRSHQSGDRIERLRLACSGRSEQDRKSVV